LSKDGWAQFRERVTCVGEDELAAFIRDHAALLRPATMGEEEFAVSLHGYADFLRNGWPKEPAIPLKATARTPPRSALVMSEDELEAYIRDNKIESFVPTPESEAEQRWEAQLLEAIESGEIGRKKPGRKPVRPTYLARARELLDEAGGNYARAREAFIKQEMKSQNIKEKTAENRWAEAVGPLFTKRRSALSQ
jgi:hypothetical protein